MSAGASDSAPAAIKWCCKCRAPMITREFGGKARRACSACKHIHFIEPKVGVGVAVIEDERILLVQRGFAPQKGKWSLPAGYLDHGDDPQQQAIVEAREETNLHVKLSGLAGVFHNPPQEGGASVFILYWAERIGGELRAGDDALAAEFFARDALPEIAFASTRHVIELLQQRQL
jgi:ADP-ribose pyrophosphatase YjhB (NUDIX family)